MFCVRCGKALSAGMTVCPTCKAPVPAKNPASRPSPAVTSAGQANASQAVAPQKSAGRPMHPDQLIGGVIAGRYRLLEKLGSGGMGSVFKAEDMEAKRLAAVKVLSFELVENPEFVARFEREAKTGSHIKHPNAVETFDSGRTEDGIVYIAMEYLDGPLLSRIIKDRAPLQLDRVVDYTRQAAAALDAGHRLSIVHRDFKPDNVIICTQPDGSERLKVLDFGVAKQTLLDAEVQKLTRTGFMVGTPQYISPEQLQGQPVGPPSDLYSLGVVVYQMLTGALPFVGNSPQKQMLNRLLNEPMPFSHVNPDIHVPPGVEPAIMKALARNPSDRYLSALDFAAELERAAHVRAVAPPPPPAYTAAPPPFPNSMSNAAQPSAAAPSNKYIWIILIVALVVAIIAIAIFMWAMS
ncbi:MAG TPA: serine/threonine-protein kinase [Blastocatellia bacterium]|nr:serine/threonine-protein kinase [Blastocatellia bacterium]